MSSYQIYLKQLILLAPLLLTACDRNPVEPPIPQATLENCTPEFAEKIKNVEVRNKFLNNCALLSTYKPSKPRGW